MPVNVNDLIETSVSLIRSSFGSSSVDVLLDMEPGHLSVKADAVQIEQVLTNMFKNAFEAMGAKGRLTVRSRRNVSEILITVSDTGPGIPAELQSRIFNPFFTTKIRGSGTGLGLSICNGIIRKHGGRLELDSSSEGTEFRIILPAASEDINSGRSGTQSSPENILQRMVESGMQRTPSMLVVDDEPEIGRLVTELFCYKFDIEVVGNGREALDRMRERQFDIIISDIKMPLVDGIEFHRIVSAVFPQYLNRIIYTTGVAFDRDVSAFLKRTGVPYLPKPFKVAQLMKIVTGMLEKGDDCRAVA
jgi:CheY-like chemotaxis protein